MPSESEKQFEAAKLRVVRGCGICLAVVVAVFLVPKRQVSMDSTRLGCTIGFFAALIGFGVLMLRPRERLHAAILARRYRDSPITLENYWKRYLFSLNRLLSAMVGIYLVMVCSIALRVLSARQSGSGPWIAALAPLNESAKWIFLGSLTALLLFPFYMTGVIGDVAQRRQALREQESMTDFEELETDRASRATSAVRGKSPVEVSGGGRFSAGEIDWSWEDLEKNTIVFGQTGSGKTICVLNALLEGVMRATDDATLPIAGLVLDPKGDYEGKLGHLCEMLGRGDDLLVLDPADPEHSIRWNPFDSDDDELELASRFAAVLEAMGTKSENDSFWIDSAKKFIRHAIALIRLTNRREVPPSFAAIQELAVDGDAVVARLHHLDVTDDRCEQCLGYFANEWLRYPPEQRAGIQGNISNMIDPFLMPPYSEVFSGRSTIRVGSMIGEGKLLYVNMPVAEKETMSRMICTFLKLEYFREILKARDKKRPSFFLCDEFQVYFTTGQGKSDADFFERSRQSKHANIIATQNFPALLKVTPKEAVVENLLGNCAVKIFLRNTESKTNEWASSLFGEALTGVGGSQSGSGGGKKGFPGSGSGSTGSSDQFVARVRKEKFASLAIPDRKGFDYAETFVHLASRPEPEKWSKPRRWKVHPLRSDPKH